MRNLITTIALLTLLSSPGAIAQTTGSTRSSAELVSPIVGTSMTSDTRLIGSAPIGHRQPRASDVPSENPNVTFLHGVAWRSSGGDPPSNQRRASTFEPQSQARR
jgi:hypothetical protein